MYGPSPNNYRYHIYEIDWPDLVTNIAEKIIYGTKDKDT
jgi:hypothetical protein